MFHFAKQIYEDFKWELRHSEYNFLKLSLLSNQPIQRLSRFQLISAAAEGDLAKVKYLFETETDVDAKRNPALNVVEIPGYWYDYTLKKHKYSYNTTPLHFACLNGHLEVVRFIIRNDADIEARDDYGFTALHLASGNGHKSVVESLIESGANCNDKNSHGVTPLHFAAEEGHLDVLQYLILNGAYFNARTKKFNISGKNSLYVKNWTPLICSINNNRFGVMKVLLQKAVSVNIDYIDSLRNAEPEAFFIAVEFLTSTDELVKQVGLQNMQLILQLVIKTPDELGFRRIKVFELLIKSGVDINFKYKSGITALHYAVINEELDIVKILLKNNADVNAVSFKRSTPLHYSLTVENHDTRFADVLLEHGCSRTTTLDCLKTMPWSHHIEKSVILYHVLYNPEDENLFSSDKFLENRTDNKYIGLSKYWDECLEEISRMKKKVIGNYSIYTVCVEKILNKLASYTENESLHRHCEPGSCQTNYPIYGNLILKKFEQGKRRAELNGKLHLLYVYFREEKKVFMNRDCWLNISKHLSNTDLFCLIRSTIR